MSMSVFATTPPPRGDIRYRTFVYLRAMGPVNHARSRRRQRGPGKGRKGSCGQHGPALTETRTYVNFSQVSFRDSGVRVIARNFIFSSPKIRGARRQSATGRGLRHKTEAALSTSGASRAPACPEMFA